MLSSSTLQTLICSTQLDAAKRFYGETLDLRMTGTAHGALLFAVGGSTLRVSPVPNWSPSGHTAVGFAVQSLQEEMLVLARRGVKFERFAGLPQDADAVLRLTDGTRVAWLKDPDGNILSLVQYA